MRYRVRILTIAVICLHVGVWQLGVSVSLAAQAISPQAIPGQVREVVTFLRGISDSLPALVRDDTLNGSYRLVLSRSVIAQVDRLNWGGALYRTSFLQCCSLYERSLFHQWQEPKRASVALAGLDTLRGLWSSVPVPARRAWLLEEEGLRKLTSSLLVTLANFPELRPVARRFGQSALKAAQERIRQEHAEALTAVAYTVIGITDLLEQDTVRAVAMLFKTVHNPRTFISLPVARMLGMLAAAQGDSAQWLKALTLQHLETSWRNDTINVQANMQLRKLFDSYTADGKPLPDLAPNRLANDSMLPMTVTLDTYLDRQWAGLYDREFPVTQATISPDVSSRLAVVEYMTGVACASCWIEDRAFQPLLRRYPEGQVLPLAYHNWQPIVGSGDLWYRFAAWYPIPTEFYPRKPNMRRLPDRLAVSSQGDTVNYAVWVNGRGLPRDRQVPFLPDGQSTYDRTVRMAEAVLEQDPAFEISGSAILKKR